MGLVPGQCGCDEDEPKLMMRAGVEVRSSGTPNFPFEISGISGWDLRTFLPKL